MEFIHQPSGTTRLGSYLKTHLLDPQWADFRAAIAFVKRSGTQHIREELARFDQRATVLLSVGVSFFGTSKEGLHELIDSVTRGEIYVYHNPGSSTFHPKIYLFKNPQQAHVLVGSGNLTEGGLFTNYESSLSVELDLSRAADAAFLGEIEQVLDVWSQPADGTCYKLTYDFLRALLAEGLVKSEAQLAAIAQQAAITAPPARRPAVSAGSAGATHAPLFTPRRVPAAPRKPVTTQPSEAAETLTETEADAIPAVAPPAPAAAPTYLPTSFVMTLQNTDVGIGQKSPGKSRRSPEVFIPLAALDLYPDFWGFHHQFKSDKKWDAKHPRARRKGLGKLDRFNVPMRIGTIQQVNMFFNPGKKDLRLRSEPLRSSGKIGDVIWIQRVDPSIGFEYDVQVAPQGTALFAQLQRHCTRRVPNSRKTFGYL